MISLSGRCSFFGGQNDSEMLPTEGLSLFEHSEADKRPDLFNPRSEDPLQGTSKRLSDEALYIAIRFTKEDKSRSAWQKSAWRVINPKNGKSVMCSLCDWGPNESTGRVVDLSPAIGIALSLETDDVVEVECLTF